MSMQHLVSLNKLIWMNRSWRDWLELYTSNSSKGCVLKVYLKYPKDLCELHSNDKIEFKTEMLSIYLLRIFAIFLLAILKNYCLNF